MRNHLIDRLIQLAKNDERIVFLCGDLGYNLVERFNIECPGRFYNMGISEQNMASVATGLALDGKIACIYSIGSFPTLRCLEQIRNGACYHNVNVKIISIGGGFIYGQLGMSHHATEDIAIMRALPNMRIYSPADPIEATIAINDAISVNGPCYIRLGRGGEPNLHNNSMFNLSQFFEFYHGDKIALISTGSVIQEAIEAANKCKAYQINVGVYNAICLKPIDKDSIEKIANQYDVIITVEEHNVIGGLGTIVADTLMELHLMKTLKLIKLGLNDEFTSIVGSNTYLRDQYGISSDKLVSIIKKVK